MSRFNPYAVEEVPFANAAVSVFAGQGRYSGGVSGLGGEGEVEPMVFEEMDIYGRTPAAKERDSIVDRIVNWGRGSGAQTEVQTASLPGWAPILALGVLGVGGYFVWKAIKRR